MSIKRKSAGGFQIVQMIGVLFLTIIVSALAVDFGFYFAAQNQMQTSADAAAMAATSEMFHNTSVDPEDRMDDARAEASEYVDLNTDGLVLDEGDVIFGFIDPDTKTYDPATFRTPSSSSDYELTGGYNAVRVKVRRGGSAPNDALNTIMANFFGVHSMNTQATSVALIDSSITSITDGGVRPIYACEELLNRAMQDGIAENNVVRIYGDYAEIDGVNIMGVGSCSPPPSGNWGYADFTDCGAGTVGASTIRDWFANGYPGTVDISECYSTKPGNFISSMSDELDTLIAENTIFPIPLYDEWQGNGSNTHVHLTGFVGFKITGYNSNGAESSRYIEGRFYQTTCKTGCDTGAGGSAPGGAMVKLRYASK